MTTFFTPKNEEITLETQISSGGEGVIWQTQIPDLVAKIYHKANRDQLRKLQSMVQSPPHDPTLSMDHISIAWPQDVLFSKAGEFVGFLMPRVSGSLTLNNVYHPKLRKQKAAGFNWYYLLTTAMNISSILESLHSRGYVVGDIKTDNFLINERALVSLTDTDSFQVKTARELFRCPVGSEGFTPPELVGKDFQHINRSEEHDLFGLSVLVYLLLMGVHPYSGTWKEGAEPLPRDEAVAGCFWPYGPSSVVTMSKLAISLDVLYPPIKNAFLETFNVGHSHPKKRVKAAAWKKILQEALDNLVLCKKNTNHFYDKHSSACPWCLRHQKLGTDVFPQIEGENRLHVMNGFSKALQTKDQREMLRLWEAHEFLRSDAKFKCHKAQMNEIRTALATFDAFKEKCQSGASDQAIVEMWAKNPALKVVASFPHEQVNGQPIQAFLAALSERREQFVILRDAIIEADHKFQQKQSNPSFEEGVFEAAKEYHAIAAGNDQLDDLTQNRIDLAGQRLAAWQVLQHAKDHSEEDFLEAWRSAHSLLKGFDIAESLLNKASNAVEQERVLQVFLTHLKDRPYDDQGLVLIWNNNPSFQESTYAADQVYKKQSIANFVENAKKRDDLYTHLTWVENHGTLKEMAEAWDENLCAEHPRFEGFQAKIGHAHALYKKWQKVRKALLEDETTQVLSLWDESLTPFAQEYGLAKQVQDIFLADLSYRSQFPLDLTAEVAHHKDYWHITFPWPRLVLGDDSATTPAPYVIVATRPHRLPKDAEDVVNGMDRASLPYQEGSRMGESLLPKTDDAAYFSLWAACYICGKLLHVGDPLSLTPGFSFGRLTYKLKEKWGLGSSDKKSMQVKMTASQDLFAPTIMVMATEGRSPIFQDPEGIKLGEIVAQEFTKGETVLDVTLDQGYDSTMLIKLFPADPAFLDSVTMLKDS